MHEKRSLVKLFKIWKKLTYQENQRELEQRFYTAQVLNKEEALRSLQSIDSKVSDLLRKDFFICHFWDTPEILLQRQIILLVSKMVATVLVCPGRTKDMS